MLTLLAALPAIIASTPALAATAPVHAWAFPLTLPADSLAALCGRDGNWLEHWQEADLRYDSKSDGIHGTLTYGVEFWLRDTKSLAESARIGKSEGPQSRCRGVYIEVWSPATGKVRSIADSELGWRGQMDAGAGVMRLDVTDYVAVIPGLRIGDRLRVTWRWEWTRFHGLPINDLVHEGNGPVLTTISLQAPVDQHLSYAYVGPDSLAAGVHERRTSAGGRQRLTWTARDERTADLVLARRKGGSLTLVPHLAVTDARRTAGAFVGADTWAGAAAAYREHIMPLLEPTPAVATTALSVVEGLETPAERIAALYAHVQATTRYLGLFNGRGGIIPALPEATQQAGFGDCKGLSSYFIALCRAVGIEAWPVLVLADEEQELAAGQPNLTQFNHFIAWANDGQGGCWIDPTLEDFPAGVLAPVDGLQPVMSTRPGFEGLCRIPRAAWEPGLRRVEVNGAIDPALRLHGTVTLTAEGPGGALLALYLDDAKDARSRDAQSRELLLAPPLRASALPAAAADSNAPPLTWSRAFHAGQPLPGDANRLFLAAEIACVPELARGGDRKPVDPRRRPDRLETWRLELPDGWNLAAPDSFSRTAPGLVWERTVRQDGRRLLLERRLDWGDSTLSPAQAVLLDQALAEAAARERSPLQLKRKVP